MIFAQEIHYTTTGLSKKRKNMYLILYMEEQNARNLNVIEAMNREHFEVFLNRKHVVQLPALNVTSNEYKNYATRFNVK